MQHAQQWVMVVLVMVSAGLQLSACAQRQMIPITGAEPDPARVEPIEGSDLKRVVLTERAAERLGIETALVVEERVTRKRDVGGRVVASPHAEGDSILVRVVLSEGDLARVDRTHPAVVFRLGDADDDDEEVEGLEAEAVDDVEDDDAEDSALYFAVDNPGRQALAPGQPVRVKLALVTSGATRKIIPYSAVIYDVHGETWAYIREAPGALAFVRARISVDYIEGESAFLADGPPAGTEVVTVGGALLYGAETGVSK